MIIPLLIYIIIVLNMQSFVLMMYFHTVLVAEHKHLSLNLECGKMSDLFNQKWKLCHYFYMPVSFQNCDYIFLAWNTEGDVLQYVHSALFHTVKVNEGYQGIHKESLTYRTEERNRKSPSEKRESTSPRLHAIHYIWTRRIPWDPFWDPYRYAHHIPSPPFPQRAPAI